MAKPHANGDLVGKKLGKYELLALIAVGGTAEIYLARISGASGFEKYLVVKSLLDHLADDPEFVKMFLDEARVGAQLDHSNIVQTLELGQQDGRYFLVMEYLAGMSLAQLARKTQEREILGGLLDPNLVFGLAAQACGGLHYAHNRKLKGRSLNLVHRDISPQNLVVSFEGILKIVDFGIAKSDIREAQTKTGTIKGKFAYMSPEQCLAKDLDQRTDIFALGTICHELLTGRRLFKRASAYDTYQAIVSGNYPKPSDLNASIGSNIDAVIMKALAHKPEDRYQSAQEFGDALLGILHERGGSGGPSEVSRFFDDYFQDELEDHANQMRELISGKVQRVGEGTWDSDFGEINAMVGGMDTMVPAGNFQKQAPVQRPVSEPEFHMEAPKRPQPPPERTPPPLSASKPKPIPSIPKIPSILPRKLNMEEEEDEFEDEGPTRVEFDPGLKIAKLHEEVTPAPSPPPTRKSVTPPPPSPSSASVTPTQDDKFIKSNTSETRVAGPPKTSATNVGASPISPFDLGNENEGVSGFTDEDFENDAPTRVGSGQAALLHEAVKAKRDGPPPAATDDDPPAALATKQFSRSPRTPRPPSGRAQPPLAPSPAPQPAASATPTPTVPSTAAPTSEPAPPGQQSPPGATAQQQVQGVRPATEPPDLHSALFSEAPADPPTPSSPISVAKEAVHSRAPHPSMHDTGAMPALQQEQSYGYGPASERLGRATQAPVAMQGASSKGTSPAMHALVFVLFLGVGIGLAAIIRML